MSKSDFSKLPSPNRAISRTALTWLLAIVASLGLIAAACGGDDDVVTPADDVVTSDAEAGDDGDEATTPPVPTPAGDVDNTDLAVKPLVEVPDGEAPADLELTDLVIGDGVQAAAGDFLITQYVGVSYGTGLQFDSSWDRGQAFSFVVGEGNVIQGWDDGIVGMAVGGRRELIIPSELAYGPTGSGSGSIGPDEPLIFVVDLLGVLPQSVTKPEVSVPAEPAVSVGIKPVVEVPANAAGSEYAETDLTMGEGPTVDEGDIAVIRYVGVAVSTGAEVDTAWVPSAVRSFTVGSGEVIEGWDRGVVGMSVGGLRQLVVPPELAFGDEGTETVAPDETLVYVVELLGLMRADVTKPDVDVPDALAVELGIRDVIEGDGAVAQPGSTLVMQYVGVSQSTGEEFDTSWGRAPFTFTLRQGQVIQGWDDGIEGMAAGGRRELIIPGEQAYGDAGSGAAIGPNETLVFVVDLVAVVPSSQVVTTDIIEGTGEAAGVGSVVWVHYVGASQSNGEQFDASWDRGREETINFALGAGQVIPGWDQGIQGMKVGGRRELIIPADLAYGEAGAGGGAIAPNETLVFVVDLVAIS